MPTSEIIKIEEKNPMETLLKQRADLISLPKLGDIIEGTIIEKKGSKVFIDLGPWGSGIIYGREFYEAQDILKNLKEGDTVTAKIVDVDNDEGYIELSMKEAGREKNWRDLTLLMESGEALPIKVAEANRGGLMLEYKGVKGFLPVSQLSSKNYPKVEGGDKEKIYEELKKFVGQELIVKIMDVNQAEEKLIFSEKSQENQELREKISKHHVGDIVEGEVSGIVSFGAFVRFGDGLEGLVHISEMDWRLVENPAAILKTGEKISVKIIDIQGEKISLSLKALKENPWEIAAAKYNKGDSIKGVVGKLNTFGAFVKVSDDIQGLAHISEFGDEQKMKSALEQGKEYDFVVLHIDAKERRLALGLPKHDAVVAESETKIEPAKKIETPMLETAPEEKSE